ncbi:SPOSA6832_03508 [Sporobolomyces salmonicolor]|uniref:Man(5)GlcNAc(2)-PP-dolichol translocation protein RFT1 n=1 Tax=Sporidiobolus salmonicolor TaxID=5005 RepID=A0A0D6EPH0_SPOSA|nr:SPOSA6832_03508 [Sporobolomyces salmonicolor]
MAERHTSSREGQREGPRGKLRAEAEAVLDVVALFRSPSYTMSSNSNSNPVLSTTLALVALQLGSRAFSFALNQLLLRSTDPQAFGVATIQLDTLRDTVLFLLREGIRGAVIPAHYTPTLVLYALSALLELLSEPYYLRTLQSWERLTSTRVRIEGAAVVAKAVATLVALRLGGEDGALLAYGWGQVAYALTLLVGLWGAVGRRDGTDREKREVRRWALDKVEGRYFDSEVAQIGWALTKQSVIKQVLTEGDKLAVARYAKGEDMGGYAVALNYGSLVARILFQPLEESSRLYFSSLSSSSSAPSASPSSSLNPTPAALLSCASHLRLLLTFYTHLTLLLLLLAPAFTTPLLHALLGARWSATSAAAILKSYVLSLPFLAFNGLTEAFFQSVADPRSIRHGSVWMGVCTAAFAGAVWASMGRAGLGAQGLVGANCVNMAMRTAFSTAFMVRWFERETAPLGESEQEEVRTQLRWRSWRPRSSVVVAVAAAGVSERRWEVTVLRDGGGWRPLAEHFAASQKDELRMLVGALRRRRGGKAE